MDANGKSACAELIQAWGLYRDQGKWPQLLATFVPEGEIAVSWLVGPTGGGGGNNFDARATRIVRVGRLQ